MELHLDRYYTLMIIPEKNKDVRSIKIPRLLFKSLVFLFVTFGLSLVFKAKQRLTRALELNLPFGSVKGQTDVSGTVHVGRLLTGKNHRGK
jgi:hypothetical protein